MSRADKQRLPEYLEHIVQAIRRIEQYIEDIDEASFLQDEKTQDAVIRNFEVIGEACNNVSKYHGEFASRHPDIPWGFAYEMRNALAHGYFKIDLEIVWNTVHSKLPDLLQRIENILAAGEY